MLVAQSLWGLPPQGGRERLVCREPLDRGFTDRDFTGEFQANTMWELQMVASPNQG
jgi:hypothetical protein